MLRASIRSLHRITATCISTSPPRVDASPPSQGPQISSEMQIMVRSASLPANCFNLCRGWMRTNSRQTKLTADLRNWLFLPLVLSLHPYSNSAKKKKDFNAKQRTLQNVTHCSKILRLARIRILKLVLDKDFVLAFSEGQVLQNYNITCKILIARLWAILFQRPYLYVSAQKVLISLSWQSGLRWGCVISLGWGCVIPQRWGFVIFPEALGLTPTQVLEIGCVILELKYFRIYFCNSLRKSKNSSKDLVKKATFFYVQEILLKQVLLVRDPKPSAFWRSRSIWPWVKFGRHLEEFQKNWFSSEQLRALKVHNNSNFIRLSPSCIYPFM